MYAQCVYVLVLYVGTMCLHENRIRIRERVARCHARHCALLSTLPPTISSSLCDFCVHVAHERGIVQQSVSRAVRGVACLNAGRTGLRRAIVQSSR